MQSVMNHNFSGVPSVSIPRSRFTRDHGYKTTFNADRLIPVFTDEVLPGDTMNLKATMFCRMATPIAPILDNLFLDTFYFFVPNRIIWDNWEKFNGAQEDPGDSIDFVVPVLTAKSGGHLNGSLSDYFGIPTLEDGVTPNALHYRAYNLIYNEWFRDQNLQDSSTVLKTDGPDPHTNYFVRHRCKRHDYVPSALPWPQKGDAVDIGIAGNAAVIGDGTTLGLTNGTTEYGLITSDQGNVNAMLSGGTPALGDAVAASGGDTGPFMVNDGKIGVSATAANSGLIADLSTADAVTINQLRQSFQIQKMLEKDARGGTRYTEILRTHFGVTSPDFRLQRPEYLGGSSTPFIISPVAQTQMSDAAVESGGSPTPQGNLAAYGLMANKNKGFSKSFVEHGVIIGLVNVRADITYQQGLHKMWSRQTRYDFYWPSFAHLGEQAVLNQEIYFNQADGFNQDAFGYQERYAEYRYKPSLITGGFRSNETTPLDFWHLSQDFGTRPALDDTFILSDTPMARVQAVTTEPSFLFDAFFDYKCVRPMPVYSVPGKIDHF